MKTLLLIACENEELIGVKLGVNVVLISARFFEVATIDLLNKRPRYKRLQTRIEPRH